jgi:hypothetical protein
MFNPKAMVIFHDGTKEVPDPNQFEIFKPYYEGEDLEKAMYGAGMYNSAFGDGNGAPSGGLVRYFYNQADNTVTFYYRDSKRNRWIISKEPYRQQVLANAPTAMSIYDRIVSPNTGDRHVYKWILWQRSALV